MRRVRFVERQEGIESEKGCGERENMRESWEDQSDENERKVLVAVLVQLSIESERFAHEFRPFVFPNYMSFMCVEARGDLRCT